MVVVVKSCYKMVLYSDWWEKNSGGVDEWV